MVSIHAFHAASLILQLVVAMALSIWQKNSRAHPIEPPWGEPPAGPRNDQVAILGRRPYGHKQVITQS